MTMAFNPLWLVYLLPLVGIWAFIPGARSASVAPKRPLSIKQQAEEAGLVEPHRRCIPSLISTNVSGAGLALLLVLKRLFWA